VLADEYTKGILPVVNLKVYEWYQHHTVIWFTVCCVNLLHICLDSALLNNFSYLICLVTLAAYHNLLGSKGFVVIAFKLLVNYALCRPGGEILLLLLYQEDLIWTR
jgi:hypothetical protein